MNSAEDTPCGVGFPIRKSRDQRSLASTPGLSQRATSFFASQCQGIHQMPLFLTLDRKTRRLQGEAPQSKISHEDTLHSPEAPLGRARDGAGVETLRILPIHLVKDRRRTGHSPPANSLLVPIRINVSPRMVEVSGIEPLTSCLQSRRSPN